MMLNFDCSAMWMKDSYQVSDAFNVEPLYLKHKHQEEVIDFRVRVTVFAVVEWRNTLSTQSTQQ